MIAYPEIIIQLISPDSNLLGTRLAPVIAVRGKIII